MRIFTNNTLTYSGTYILKLNDSENHNLKV